MKSLADYVPYTSLYVDAMNLMARSFHGMSTLEYKGRKTGMLMGTARLVLDWRRKCPGIKIVFVWEGANSWRKAAEPMYKSNRKRDDGEARNTFFECVDQVIHALPAMGVDQVKAETYEADDTVWTVMGLDSGKKLFCSTDWDWWPLALHGDILYQNDVFTEDELRARFAKKYNCDPIPLDRLWMFKALTGDPSDGLSGVPRFPKKLAAKLAIDTDLSEGDILHGLIKHGEPKWAERVAQNIWIVDRNLSMVRFEPPPLDDIDIVEGEFNKDAFGEVLLKAGMIDLNDRLMGGSGE